MLYYSEGYVRKRIHHGCSVQSEKFIPCDNRSASLGKPCRVMPNGYTKEQILLLHLALMKDSYNLVSMKKVGATSALFKHLFTGIGFVFLLVRVWSVIVALPRHLLYYKWASPWQNLQNDMCAKRTQISLGIRLAWSVFAGRSMDS